MAPLREDLLAGRTVAVAGPLRGAVGGTLAALGARLEPFADGLDDEGADDWARDRAPLHGLVYDAAAAFGCGGREGLLATVEHMWPAIRAVAAAALIPAGAGGRIVVIAPAADAHPHTQPARAALENMARTLSIEWARYAITATVLAPGSQTSDADLATLAAFLLSHAGAYFSGCRFELR